MIKKKIQFISDQIGENVLVIGGGPSAVDITNQLLKTAKQLTSSQHHRYYETRAEHAIRQNIFGGVTIKDDIKRFTPHGIEFSDGSHRNFTVVIFATGKNHFQIECSFLFLPLFHYRRKTLENH